MYTLHSRLRDEKMLGSINQPDSATTGASDSGYCLGPVCEVTLGQVTRAPKGAITRAADGWCLGPKNGC